MTAALLYWMAFGAAEAVVALVIGAAVFGFCYCGGGWKAAVPGILPGIILEEWRRHSDLRFDNVLDVIIAIGGLCLVMRLLIILLTTGRMRYAVEMPAMVWGLGVLIIDRYEVVVAETLNIPDGLLPLIWLRVAPAIVAVITAVIWYFAQKHEVMTRLEK